MSVAAGSEHRSQDSALRTSRLVCQVLDGQEQRSSFYDASSAVTFHRAAGRCRNLPSVWEEMVLGRTARALWIDHAS